MMLSGCANPSTFEDNAHRTGIWALDYGDGYRQADDPAALVQLIGTQAAQNDGQVVDSGIAQRSPLVGHVDVRYQDPGDRQAPAVCWRLGFRQQTGDAYIRNLTYTRIRCPARG
jgi:hypothetical protein